jgi:hypothetical protein
MRLQLFNEYNTVSHQHTAQRKLCRRIQSQASSPFCNNYTHRINMSQVATITNSEAIAAVIGAENVDPNALSEVHEKKKDLSEENLICSENFRSESSTPVKEIVEDQPVLANQIAGNLSLFFFVQTIFQKVQFFLFQRRLLDFCDTQAVVQKRCVLKVF